VQKAALLGQRLLPLVREKIMIRITSPLTIDKVSEIQTLDSQGKTRSVTGELQITGLTSLDLLSCNLG
jgi:hypothetical protein